MHNEPMYVFAPVTKSCIVDIELARAKFLHGVIVHPAANIWTVWVEFTEIIVSHPSKELEGQEY